MTARRFISVAILTLIFSLSQAQDFRRSFEDFTAAAQEIHRHFGDSINASFSQAISLNWEQFHLYEADSKPYLPQPYAPSVARESEKEAGGAIKISGMVDTLPALFSTDRQVFYHSPSSPGRSVNFVFYDAVQTVTVPLEYGRFHPGGISETDVGEFWYKLSQEDYSPIVLKCLDNRERYGYNDWAVLEWVRALSNTLFPDNIHSERTVFEVFILNQMGLMVKLARVDDRLEGLFSALQPVFARKYVVIDTYQYYLTDAQSSVSDIYTYRPIFRGKLRPLDLRIKSPLDLGTSESFTLNHFNSQVFDCMLEMPMNHALMSFYDTYPQTTINVYAQSIPAGWFSGILIKHLKNKLFDYDESAILNELLRFLQYDFKYKVDTEQFGREKQFFCEENFLYEANDCEDRAVLFSYLVRQMTGHKVVLLEYDDHIATAVRLDADLKGHYVNLADGRYYICDPTFIGATIGMCIPKYADRQAKVYVL